MAATLSTLSFGWPLFTPRNISDTHFCWGPSQPQGYRAAERINLEKFNDVLANINRHLPVCSIAPQLSRLAGAPVISKQFVIWWITTVIYGNMPHFLWLWRFCMFLTSRSQRVTSQGTQTSVSEQVKMAGRKCEVSSVLRPKHLQICAPDNILRRVTLRIRSVAISYISNIGIGCKMQFPSSEWLWGVRRRTMDAKFWRISPTIRINSTETSTNDVLAVPSSSGSLSERSVCSRLQAGGHIHREKSTFASVLSVPRRPSSNPQKLLFCF
jgi:hypothetical protein